MCERTYISNELMYYKCRARSGYRDLCNHVIRRKPNFLNKDLFKKWSRYYSYM